MRTEALAACHVNYAPSAGRKEGLLILYQSMILSDAAHAEWGALGSVTERVSTQPPPRAPIMYSLSKWQHGCTHEAAPQLRCYPAPAAPEVRSLRLSLSNSLFTDTVQSQRMPRGEVINPPPS